MLRCILEDLWHVAGGLWNLVFPNRRRYRVIQDQLSYLEGMSFATWELLNKRTPSPYEILNLAAVLRESNDALAAALQAYGVPQSRSVGVISMNPLQPIIDEVTRARGAQASATALINGFQAKLNAAVAAALAGGASAQQIADLVSTELAALASSTTELGTAIDANDD
jgi:hypothetical protein